MHVYFSGIGGAAISALAAIAKEAGYEVSGSDARDSQYLEVLRKKGITDIHVGLTREEIARVHQQTPIDWFVYGSAQPLDFPDNPEFAFCKEMGIKQSKRDELLNKIITDKKLKLIAIAGTHGKTTTTAMVIWLFKQLGVPVSYSVGAKIDFGDMGVFDPLSQYFVYEADEFDRNFLSFRPFFSIISGLSWDHHEIFPTLDSYNQAFRDFLNQSQRAILWDEDAKKINLDESAEKYAIESSNNPDIQNIKLAGKYNRRDGWLALKSISQIIGPRPDELYDKINQFPGVSRRFEKITENLYTDYAHTPDKIAGVMSVAKETAAQTGQKIVIIYEPLTNRRMHYTKDQHQEVFSGADAIYWVPSFLAREDPSQPVLSPAELIKSLNPQLQAIAKPMDLNDELKQTIQNHLQNGDLVVGLSGGGSGSLDEWLRQNFAD